MMSIGKIIGLRNEMTVRDFTIGFQIDSSIDIKNEEIRNDFGIALLILLKFWKHANFSPRGVNLNSADVFIQLLNSDVLPIIENITHLSIIEDEVCNLSNYHIITSFSITSFESYQASQGSKVNINDKLSFRFNDYFRETILINELDDFDFKI